MSIAARVSREFGGEFGGLLVNAEAWSYEEFEAWAAYLHHTSIHATDAAAQAEHDRVMAAAAVAAGSF